MTTSVHSELLPQHWMQMRTIELESLLNQLEGDQEQWVEDRRTLAKTPGITDESREYRRIVEVIADHNRAINALHAFLRTKNEGERAPSS